MKDMNHLKKLYHGFSDLIEVYIPCVVFIFLFVTYAILIFCRYALNTSIDWMYELNTFAFVWCGVLAASYGSRKETHVRFSILYDHVSPNVQRVMRILGDAIVVFMFIVIYKAAIGNLQFLAVRKSSILKLRFHYVYSPFMVYMTLTVIHHFIHLITDIVSLVKKEEAK